MTKKKEDKYKLKIDPDSIISVSELRRNLSKYGERAQKAPVLVMNKSKIKYAVVNVELLRKFEEMMEDMEDMIIAQRWERDKDNPDAWMSEEEFMKELKDEGIVL